MDADPPPPPALAASRDDTLLECNLAHLTQALLHRLGLTSNTSTPSNPSAIKPDAPATQLAWTPLVPLADLSSLLSLVPADQRPEQLQQGIAPAQPTSEARIGTLDTLARLALEPALTVDVLGVFRPLAVSLVGRWFDLLGLTDDGRWRDGQPGQEAAPGERDAVDKVWTALVRALPLLGNEVMPCVLPAFVSFPECIRADLSGPRQIPPPAPAPPAPRAWPAPAGPGLARVRLAPVGRASQALLSPAPPPLVPLSQRVVPPAADRAHDEDAPTPRHAPPCVACRARVARPRCRHGRRAQASMGVAHR